MVVHVMKLMEVATFDSISYAILMVVHVMKLMEVATVQWAMKEVTAKHYQELNF